VRDCEVIREEEGSDRSERRWLILSTLASRPQLNYALCFGNHHKMFMGHCAASARREELKSHTILSATVHYLSLLVITAQTW
jgi:hypothetical protein